MIYDLQKKKKKKKKKNKTGMTGSYLLEEGKKEAINGDTIKSCTKEKPCQAIYCKTDEYTCTEAVHLNSYTLFKMDEKTLLTCNESKCYPIDVEGFYLNGGLDRQTNPVIKCDKNNGCKNIMYADIKSSCEDVSIGNIIHVNDDKYYYCASKKNDDKIQIGGTEEKVLKTTIPVGSTHPFTGEVLQTGTELVLKSGNNALTVVEKGNCYSILFIFLYIPFIIYKCII